MFLERLWTRPYVFLTCGMLLLFTGFYFLLPTLPHYVKELGGGETEVGLAAGIFTLSAVLFRPFAGAWADRYGRLPFCQRHDGDGRHSAFAARRRHGVVRDGGHVGDGRRPDGGNPDLGEPGVSPRVSGSGRPFRFGAAAHPVGQGPVPAQGGSGRIRAVRTAKGWPTLHF